MKEITSQEMFFDPGSSQNLPGNLCGATGDRNSTIGYNEHVSPTLTEQLTSPNDLANITEIP